MKTIEVSPYHGAIHNNMGNVKKNKPDETRKMSSSDYIHKI